MSTATPIARSTRRADYSATAAQVLFSLGVPVYDLADVRVYRRFATETQFTELTTGFVKAFGAGNSVNVTFTVAPRPTGGDPAVTIRVQSARVQERLTNATRSGAIVSSLLEQDLDRIATVLQEVRRDIDNAATVEYVGFLVATIPVGATGPQGPTGATGTVAAAGAGTAALPGIAFASEPDCGLYVPGTNIVALSTNGAERWRVDANGNMGIGTTGPGARLDVQNNNAGAVTLLKVANSANGTNFTLNSPASAGQYMATAAAGDAVFRAEANSIVFASVSGGIKFGNAAVDWLTFDSSGRAGIGTAPTARNNTRLQIVDAIGFPATQVASTDANSLDDYEEGSWTPGVQFGGAAVGMTFSTQSGRYIKIGKLVFVYGVIVMTAKGSSVGAATLTGLPFTVDTVDGAGLSSAYYANMATLASPPFFAVNFSTANASIRHSGGAAGSANLADTNFTNTTQLAFTGCYQASA